MLFEFPKRIGKQASRMGRAAQVALLCVGLVVLLVGIRHPVVEARLSTGAIKLAQADSIQELQKQQQQIEQQRLQVSQERDRLQNIQKAAEGNLSGLKRTIKATTSQVKQTEANLKAATQRLQKLEAGLMKAEDAYRQKQFSTVARLRFLQRQQMERGWAVLLQSQNLNQFFDRRRQLRLIYASDQEMLVGLKQSANLIDQQRKQVEQQKNKIVLFKEQLLAQKADFETEAGSQQDKIERLKTDHKALEVAEEQLLQDSQNISALIKRRVGLGSTAYRGTGQMLYPCLGEVTSGFGWRTHPILGYQRFHAGLDIGADYGTVIHAADGGIVIFAGWYGGYGNAVIIDHGGGITTLYGHTSEMYVVEGQTVQRGQAIAAVGSTGFSTGPHLHFEVRQSGEPVDPATYL
ncbi:MAG: peptidoglycan DD-metalloendopeptidase family protein [Kovacikia sp.]